MDSHADHSHAQHLHSDWADRAGIWASTLCLIHCAAMPILLILLPGLFVGGDHVHVVMALLLPILSLAAFIPGYRHHGQVSMATIGSVGLVFILVALWSRPWWIESTLTMTGSVILILAHRRNRQLMSTPCKCPKTPSDG